MGLSRAEIELLIKARDEAKGTFDTLNRTIKGVGTTSDQTTVSMDKLGQETKTTGVAAQASAVALGLLADRLGRALVSGFTDSIRAANQLDAGLIGLSSAARAFNQDADKSRQAAQDLASDGLMTVGEAAGGLKNLLAAGFGLPEAITIMNRFKDSAAFGRQGSLAFGQAIVGATEGIKNGNSALVDNAGLTKNLSVILTEAGYAATDLQKASSDVNVRMALFKGILKETNPQLGDAARYLDTAAGKQAQFNSQIEIAKQKIGKELQPVLGSIIDTLTPLAKAVGNNADLVVKLGTVMGLVTAPILAAKAAALLGIDSLVAYGAAWLGAGTAATTAAVQVQAASVKLYGANGQILTTADGLSGVATQGPKAAAGLGLAAKAGIVLATAYASWQIGKWIGEVTGLTDAFERMGSTAARAAEQAMRLEQREQTLDKASREVHRGVTNLTEAIQINTAANDIRIAKYDKSDAATRKRIDAELYLGRITLEQANAQKLLLDGETQANEIRKKRVTLTDTMAASEKKFKDEIKATGYTQAELLAQLKADEVGFDNWAKVVHLSDDTVKRLNDTLKAQTQAQEKHKQATEKATQETERQRQALEQLGIVTAPAVMKQLAEFNDLIERAKAEGVPLDNVIMALAPHIRELQAAAEASGLGLPIFAGYLESADRAARRLAATLPAIDATTLSGPIPGLKVVSVETEIAAAKAERLNQAYKAFGMDTPQELRKAADEAKYNYEILRDSGTATTQQLREAYQKMADAQVVATRRVPSIWRTEVAPAITQSIRTLQNEVAGSMSQMLLRAKGFKDGFVDIWKSIKSSVMNILNDMLSAYIRQFLGGMMRAIAGQQSGLGRAMAGLMPGGGGGGGFGIPGLNFGGGAAGGVPIGGANVGFNPQGSIVGGTSGGGAAAGGAGLLGNLARFGGGGMMAVGGLAQLFRAQSMGGSVLGGAQAGAGIGTMIAPGIGTAIGAGVGAVVGVFRRLFGGGPSREELAGRQVVSQMSEWLRATLSPQNLQETGNISWKNDIVAIRNVTRRLGMPDSQSEALAKGMWDSSKGGPAASQTAVQRILDLFERVSGMPGAAGGIYASGEKGVATWFGEGGQPEVGGPASFFKRIFEQLGIGGGAGGGITMNLTVNIFAQTVDTDTVKRDVAPAMLDAITTNADQIRTKMRLALGIA